ncbi:hypothetical protein FACS1894109_01570 [Spirochaetia bacterium]|nr:hypothetical protein FACS1894109_01570 [Spirochaetia bacterium]
MSVRATERLVGDVVIASGLSNSPKMVAQSVEIDAKLVTTVWFSTDNKAQSAVFPASALDRFEESAAPARKAAGKAAAGKKPGRKAK